MEKVENLNWGSVFIDFDCNADGDSERRLADGDADPSCGVSTNATYNTARNFTHYIEPGDRLIPTNDGQTTAAVAAEGDGAAIVHVNDGDEERAVTLDLSLFGNIEAGATVTPIVTTESPASDTTANALVSGAAVAVDPSTGSATLTVPAKSVTTFVVNGVSGVAAEAPAFRDGDSVQLQGIQSGKPLTVDGDAVVIDSVDTSTAGVAAQSWTVHGVSGEGSQRQHVALESGDSTFLALDGTSVVMADATLAEALADESLQWIPTTTDGSTFALVSAADARVLDVNGQSSADGAGVGSWTSNGGGNQRWSLEAVPEVEDPGTDPEPEPSDGVPSTDDPPIYSRFEPLADPGASAANYFQPYWFDSDGRHIQAHGGQIVSVTAEQAGRRLGGRRRRRGGR
nr:RICIN domain-containing protein [Demequina litorisediminis]